MNQSLRHVVLIALLWFSGQKRAGLVFAEPGEIQIRIRPAFAFPVASDHPQSQAIFRIQFPCATPALGGFGVRRLGQQPLLSRKCRPLCQPCLHHLHEDFRVGAGAGCEQLSAGSHRVVSLSASSISLFHRSLPGEFPEQQSIGILTGFFLHAVARIGSNNKLGGQLLHFTIGPD